jgi:TfoX/Sxy family transcriptional regulator of competence genes
MAYDEGLATRIRRHFSGRTDVTERKMFGGLAFLCNGRMCCGIVGTDLMVRVSKDAYESTLAEPHVRPMDFTGRPMKGFVYVARVALRTPTSLRTWLSRGAQVAREQEAVAVRKGRTPKPHPGARKRRRGSPSDATGRHPNRERRRSH